MHRRIFLRSFAPVMRNTLITIAAWTAAIATVLWQRLLWPGLKAFFPGIEDVLSPQQSKVAQQQNAIPSFTPAPALETVVIERRKPARPQRSSRKSAHRPATGLAS